jgi:hypothetical protein
VAGNMGGGILHIYIYMHIYTYYIYIISLYCQWFSAPPKSHRTIPPFSSLAAAGHKPSIAAVGTERWGVPGILQTSWEIQQQRIDFGLVVEKPGEIGQKRRPDVYLYIVILE